MDPSKTPSPPQTRLHGPWLPVLRLAWLALSILTVLIFIASLVVYFASLKTFYPSSYAVFSLVFALLSALVWFAVALLIFWRKSDDWLALLVALMLMTRAVTNTINPLDEILSFWQFPARLLDVLAFALLFLVFSLFPTGRFVPRWIGWLMVPFLGWQVAGDFNLLPPNFSQSYVFVLVWYGFLGSFVVSQLYRYHSLSDPVQRQQTKWIVFGLSMTYLIELGFTLSFGFFSASIPTGSLADMILTPLSSVATLLIPFSFGFAILRSRLWEIDRIINRTLVYGMLTALLVSLYFGSVIGLQFVLHPFTGGNQLALVGSTLLIAALFQPLRHQIQKSIDRRFYRYKYNTAHILEAFSSDLRQEVDLDQLRKHLLAVVQETMQPAHVSLWLHIPQPSHERKTRRLARVDGQETDE